MIMLLFHLNSYLDKSMRGLTSSERAESKLSFCFLFLGGVEKACNDKKGHIFRILQNSSPFNIEKWMIKLGIRDEFNMLFNTNYNQ